MNDDICIVPGCTKLREFAQNRRICGMHRTRYTRYKSYDIPEKEKLPDGIVKICKKHGPLTQEQTKKRFENKPWISCIKCLQECEDRFIDNHGKDYRDHYQTYFWISGSGGLKIKRHQYYKMLNAQNHVCDICKKPETHRTNPDSKHPNRLSIDHCHKTGKIRSLLCHNCNSHLERKSESTLTQDEIIYLEKHNSSE